MLNHYKTLGIHLKSTQEEIKAAYLVLARKYHPDHHANDADKASKMADVNVAYNVLKLPASRKEYDTQFSLMGGKPCDVCKGKAVTMKQKGFTKRVAVACTACGGTGKREV